MEVSYGGRQQAFRSEGPTAGFEQTSRSGYASLTVSGSKASSSAVYTYRTGDGTEAVFRQIGSNDCSSLMRCAYVSQVIEADGTRLDFEYDNVGSNATRLRSVTSSRGYALLLEYGGTLVTKACVLNLAIAPKPANNVCPGGVPTAAYTYVIVGGGAYRLAGATDPSGATWGFTYAGPNMGFVRPDETQPWLTNMIQERGNDDGLVEEIVDQQSFADGSSYVYGYAETPFVTGHVSSIAGGSYTDNLGNQTILRYDFPIRPYDPAQGHGNVEEGTPGEPPSPIVHQVTPGPVEVTDPLGRVTTTEYCDPTGMAGYPPNWMHRCLVSPVPVSTTDPGGIRTEMLWDMYTRNLLRARQVAAGLSNIDRLAGYDCTPANFRFCARPVTMTDARGAPTIYSYSADHGGLLAVTGPEPTQGAPRPQTRHEYAQRHAWISNGSGGYVQAAAPVWVRTATSLCRTSAATGNPAGPCAAGALDEVRTAYDYGPDGGPNNLLPRGQAVTAESGGNLVTHRTCYTYDALGRRIGEIQPNANLASCPAALAGAAPYASAQRYDIMGRVTGTIAPDPDGAGALKHAAVRNSYDAAGRLVKVETGELAAWQSESIVPAAWPGFTIFRTLETGYDAMSRKTRELVREGEAGTVRMLTEYRYDEIGRLECTAVRMDPATFGLPPYDACTPRTPAGSQGPDRITRNVYDAAGQRLQLREGVGSDVEAAEATWDYNANGQVTTVIDGNGNRAELRYDGHGRQTCWLFPSPTRPASYNDSTPATALASAGSVNGNCIDAGDFESYSYDPNGNRTSLRKRDGSMLAYSYDALNRITVKTVPDRAGLDAIHERDVFYAYDLRNLQLSARFDSASGEGVTDTYDGFGRLASSSINMGGTPRLLQYQYDANSNRTRITHPDGIYFTASYDGLNRQTWIHEQGVNGRVVAGYNPWGALAGTSRSNATLTNYGYDAVQRPNAYYHDLGGTAADGLWTFSRNPAGQIASATRENDAYAWTGHYAVGRPYTTDGLNRYTTAGPTGPGQATFGYDLNGNLTSDGSRTFTYDIENRLVSASPNVTLSYDPLGRLHEISGASGTTRFLYDGGALVAEYDGGGVMSRRYVHWTGADIPMLSYVGAGLNQLSQLHADERGSIIAVTDANGAAALNRYDEYGIPGATNSGRFQYTGQAWLPELGMYHYKGRVYSPYLGRFMQTDPVGYEDQFNLYAYVGNDPVNFADPTGTRRCSGVFACAMDVAETAGRTARDGARSATRGIVAVAAALGIATNRIVRNIRESAVIDVYRVFDNVKAFQNGDPAGSSWTIEDPRQMADWRDRLAVYPAWNEGTYVVHGTITMQDMTDGNVIPGPGPNSTAGPQRSRPDLGGGPYKGEGNEIRVVNSATTVKDQTVTPRCNPRNLRPNC